MQPQVVLGLATAKAEKITGKVKFQKTFSRKKTNNSSADAAAGGGGKKSNDVKTTAGVSKPIKITFKCQPRPQEPEDDEILQKVKEKKKKKRKGEDENVGEKMEDSKKKVKEETKSKEKLEEEEGLDLECAFPTARITRIVKSDGFDCKITAEAVFLINKATEKFVELFSEDAYSYAVEERKSFVGYKHLASVVSKGKMFDFLSDFVPEKITAEKALAERNPPETLPA